MQKINLRDLYPDVYKTDAFVDVAEEVLAVIQSQQQADAAYERRKFRHKAHYSLDREDGIENDALVRPLTPGGSLGAETAMGRSVCCTDAAALHPGQADLCPLLLEYDGGRDRQGRGC